VAELPDPEGIFIAALKAQPLVVARCGLSDSGNPAISTKIGAIFPAVRVTLVGGRSQPVIHTGSPTLQWEAWDSDEAKAALLARAINEVADQLAGIYSVGKIISSWALGFYYHSPDQETNRQRYLGQIGLLTQ